MRRLCGTVVFLMGISLATAVSAQPPVLSSAERDARMAADARALLVYRQGMSQCVEAAGKRVYSRGALSGGDKDWVRALWKRYLDYLLALDSLGAFHAEAQDGAPPALRGKELALVRASVLASYRHSLELLRALERAPRVDRVLNEEIPELGLPASTFAKFKFRFLHVARATELVASDLVAKSFAAPQDGELEKAMAEDRKVIWKFAPYKGPAMTLANGLKILQKAGFTAWFPVQKGVAEFMGDTRVLRPGRHLISEEQAAALKLRLEPGDILLTRKEWYLSNIGLPGFWPHALLYVGSSDERQAYFRDPEVTAWVKELGGGGDFEDLLRERYPEAAAASAKGSFDPYPPRCLEAISEGVVFTSMEHVASADSLVVLRPRLGKKQKALALLRAWGYYGRPYDFDFDFSTDRTLVCSELVYKAYEPASGYQGVKFPVEEVLGRPVSSPNRMARMFDEEYGTEAQQLDLVIFLDGHERSQSAEEATLAEFRKSWKRPKWHIFMQGK